MGENVSVLMLSEINLSADKRNNRGELINN